MAATDAVHLRELPVARFFVYLCDNDLNENQHLTPVLEVNRDLFAVNNQELGHTTLVQHHNGTGNERPISKPLCHISPLIREKTDANVKT